MDEHVRPATILDVARRAGVSRTTVSRVLNEPGRVTAALRDRVEQAAVELRYAPNPSARSLRSGRIGMVALLVGDISQPFMAELAQGATAAANAAGMAVTLSDLGHSDERFVTLLDGVVQLGVDGVIVSTADDLTAPSVTAALERAGRAGVQVVVSGQPGAQSVPTVPIDFESRVRLAGEHLCAVGRTKIALAVAEPGNDAAERMRRAYTEAVPERFAAGTFGIGRTFAEVRERCDALLGTETFDALIVPTVTAALGAMSAMTGHGLRPGEDIALVACESVDLAAQISPTVSTVGEPPRELGSTLVRLLVRRLEGADDELRALDQHLTVRQTSGGLQSD